MAPSSRIPTPLKQHLHRFRLGVLPVMSFIVCVIFTLWLWQRQGMTGTVVGEIEGALMDLTAGVEGELKAPPGGHYWELFDTVKRGDPIAYLDDSLIRARMETVRATAKQLEAEVEATRTEFELEHADRIQQRESDIARLHMEIERRNVELLQQQVTITALHAETTEVKSLYDALKEMRAKNMGVINEMDFLGTRREFQALNAELKENIPVYKQMKEQRDELRAKLDQFPELLVPEVEKLLEPIRREVAVQQALLQEIQVELDNCVIRSPIDGVVSMIWRYPGQRVGATDPIITIGQPDSDYVVGYVPEQQRIPLYEGMEVGLRMRNQPNSPEYQSTVAAVSPQVAPLPLRRLADQNIMEFATWIKIPIPHELKAQHDIRPGQTVQVIFRPSRRTP